MGYRNSTLMGYSFGLREEVPLWSRMAVFRTCEVNAWTPAKRRLITMLLPAAAACAASVPTGLVAGGAWELDFYRDGS